MTQKITQEEIVFRWLLSVATQTDCRVQDKHTPFVTGLNEYAFKVGGPEWRMHCLELLLWSGLPTDIDKRREVLIRKEAQDVLFKVMVEEYFPHLRKHLQILYFSLDGDIKRVREAHTRVRGNTKRRWRQAITIGERWDKNWPEELRVRLIKKQ